MNLYEEYSKVRQAIEVAQSRQKELESEILVEMKDMTVPVKTDAGSFSKVKKVTWTYSSKITDFQYSKDLQNHMKDVAAEKSMQDATLSDLRESEEKDGTAKGVATVGLRFTKKK